jgi:hypothetical protein
MLAQQQHRHHHFAAPHLCDLRTHISDMEHFWWLCHLNPRAERCKQHLAQNNKLLRILSQLHRWLSVFMCRCEALLGRILACKNSRPRKPMKERKKKFSKMARMCTTLCWDLLKTKTPKREKALSWIWQLCKDLPPVKP